MQKTSIPSLWKAEIAKKYGCSLATVQNALNGFTNSDLAKQVRKTAKAMLLIEAKKVII